MGYADGLLSTGERIAHREKQHWFVFIWGARYTILAMIIAAIAAILQLNVSSPGRRSSAGRRDRAVHRRPGGAGWTILRYINQEYVLTNRRVIEIAGRPQQEVDRFVAREDQ